MSYIVKLAVEAEADEISNLVNSAYRGESSKKGWTTEADLLGGKRTDPNLIRQLILSTEHYILCLRENSSPEILACVNLKKTKDQKGPCCYLGMLTVKPTLQTGGVGKFLMNEAEKFAFKAGFERMTLCVINLRVELMAWYERRGYVKTGTECPFPYGDLDFGDPKRDDLKFIDFEKPLRAEPKT